MRRWTWSGRSAFVAGAASAALLLTACSSDGSSPGAASPGGSPQAGKSAVRIGIAYDTGGRGDKSFNDSAAAGLDAVRAKYKLTGSDVKELEAGLGESEADREARLTQLADNGYNVIIAVGFPYAQAIKAVVPKYPNVKFAIVDDASVQAANLSDLTFSEPQGAFLVGAIAALTSKKHHVGFVGGLQSQQFGKFQAGFFAGAKQVDPTVKIELKYLSTPPDLSGVNDPSKGETAANGIYDAGADVIFTAAGGSNAGVFKAAKAKGTLAIGNVADQYLSASADVKSVIISSMIKRIDVAVEAFVDSIEDGSFKGGTRVFDLKSGGISYSTSGGKIDDIKDKVEALKQQVISGAIVVPTKP